MLVTRVKTATPLVIAFALSLGDLAIGDGPPPARTATSFESISHWSLERTIAEIIAGAGSGRGPQAFEGPPMRGEADEPDIAVRGADWPHGVEVTASVDRQEFRQLQRVRVTCQLRNRSGGHIWMRTGTGNIYLEARVRVFDGQGKPVPKTEFSRNEGGRSTAISGGSPQLAINPGDSRQIDLVPNLIYDMTRPGEYWILVEVPFFTSSHLNGGSLQSRAEAIKVRVLPEPLAVIDGRVTVPEPDRP